MRKKYLLAPGPVQVPNEVLLAMAKPLVHHRTPQFEQIFFEVQTLLQELFQTERPILTFASSGTGAMEASIANTHSIGDEVLIVRAGKFGERWGKIAEAYGLKPIYIDIEWGNTVDPNVIADHLKDNPNICSVLLQYSETSTATMFDIPRIAEIIAKTDALCIVDGITALGVISIPVEELKIDCLVGGSQKSLMLPPGLSFLYLSEKAMKRVQTSNLPKFYFDVKAELKALAKKTTAWTPAVTLIDGLHVALSMMKKIGFQNLYKRNELLMRAIHAGLKALNIEIFSKSPSVSVTAGVIPESIDGEKLVLLLKEKYGVTVAGGQDHLKGKIFRVGTLGYVDHSDIIVFFSSFEAVLKDFGYDFNWGDGIGVVEKYLYEK